MKGLFFLSAILGALVRQPRLVYSRLKMAMFYGGEKPVTVSDRYTCLLSSMAVQPEYAGKGVGMKLLNEYCQSAKRKGAESVYLTTDSGQNENTNRFYLKNGFVLMSQLSRQDGRTMNLYLHTFL